MWISSLVVTLEECPGTTSQSPSQEQVQGFRAPSGLQENKTEASTPRRELTASSVGQAIRAMEAMPALTVGQLIGQRLPVVVEAERHDSRYWHDWIARLPGVIHVEVAFVSFEEVEH